MLRRHSNLADQVALLMWISKTRLRGNRFVCDPSALYGVTPILIRCHRTFPVPKGRKLAWRRKGSAEVGVKVGLSDRRFAVIGVLVAPLFDGADSSVNGVISRAANLALLGG
jgi:hypothetical protein